MLTIDQLQSEYDAVRKEWEHWSCVLEAEPNPSLELRGQVLALRNQAYALETLYRRCVQRDRYAVGLAGGAGTAAAAAALLADRVDEIVRGRSSGPLSAG